MGRRLLIELLDLELASSSKMRYPFDWLLLETMQTECLLRFPL